MRHARRTQRFLAWFNAVFRSGSPKDWLRRPLTVVEAEAAHSVRGPEFGPEPVPFGRQNDLWRMLVAKMRDGDELWEYRSPPETWTHMCGREGVVLLRRGRVIGGVTTAMN